MGRIGIWELVLILAVFILLFGASKIPEIARSIGKAIREFRKAGNEIEDEVKSAAKDKDDGPAS